MICSCYAVNKDLRNCNVMYFPCLINVALCFSFMPFIFVLQYLPCTVLYAKSPICICLSFSVSIHWTASSILNAMTYCRYDNQNTLTTVTAGTQGTRGRLINHVHSIAKVAPSQGCVKITEYRPLP